MAGRTRRSLRDVATHSASAPTSRPPKAFPERPSSLLPGWCSTSPASAGARSQSVRTNFAARSAVINVRRHIVKEYVLSGFFAGLATMFYYLRLGTGSPSTGIGRELDSIAAVVIGGVAVSGGVGRITGTALGALVISTLASGLIFTSSRHGVWSRSACSSARPVRCKDSSATPEGKHHDPALRSPQHLQALRPRRGVGRRQHDNSMPAKSSVLWVTTGPASRRSSSAFPVSIPPTAAR